MLRVLGHEHRAVLRLSDEEVARLGAALASDAYQVTVSPTRMHVRFVSDAERAWAEDVTIAFGDTVDVAFHTGTRAQRTAFLAHLRGRLAELGWIVELEEM